MATVINESKIKEMENLEKSMKSKFEEFLLENTLATKKQIISSSKKARSTAGELAKLFKGYRKLSLAAFDKDEETKKKLKAKREERKIAREKAGKGKPSKKTAKKTTTAKKKKK